MKYQQQLRLVKNISYLIEYNSMNFIIRPMISSDVDECSKMARESFGSDYPDAQFDTMREEFEAAFSNKWWGRPNYYVCTFNGEIVGMGGYSLSWLDWDTFEMFWLSVKDGWKGKGIGTLLQNHREQEIIKESAFKNDITILFSATKTVVDFHIKNGYKVILEKAAGKEVLMGKTFLKNESN